MIQHDNKAPGFTVYSMMILRHAKEKTIHLTQLRAHGYTHEYCETVKKSFGNYFADRCIYGQVLA